MKINKKYIFWIILFLTVSFLAYCFFPIWNYDTRKSHHITNSYAESLWAGRVYLKDRNWIIITDKWYKNWYYKHIKTDLNSEFVKALIEIEDKNYYSHYWVNFLSKLRALKDNISWKKISGWSTITEQYIKNKYFSSHKRTYIQKAREWILALYFNAFRTKNHILNIYYHDVYFWNNLYWIWAAIEVYFWKNDLNKLTNEEIVILLSLINNPSIKSLEEEYFINYFAKIKSRLWYNFERTYFWKLNRKENIDNFPFVTLEKPTFWIITNPQKEEAEIVTIDSELQQHTKDVIKYTLKELENQNVTNVAVFAMIPSSREVLIYQGSSDFYSKTIDWQVDVIKALRQPGSTMKPFLYLQALEKWIWPDDLILDIESEYNSFKKDKVYISENYSLKEYWLVRLKKALWNSFNNATVRLAREIWLSEVFNFYKKYWFSFDYSFEHYWYSLVLWNPDISLENLVRSYSKLLPKNNPLPNPLPSGEGIEQSKYLLYDILSDPDNRDVSFWVNSILNTSIAQAVKTWTSSDFRDNLVVSYHPDLVLWVWVWNNDNSSMKWVTWISWAWYIWHQIIEKAISLWYITDRELDIPEWIIEDYYCLDKDCFSRELIYKKTDKQYFSRIKDNYYLSNDIKITISEKEMDRLNDLGFEIR